MGLNLRISALEQQRQLSRADLGEFRTKSTLKGAYLLSLVEAAAKTAHKEVEDFRAHCAESFAALQSFFRLRSRQNSWTLYDQSSSKRLLVFIVVRRGYFTAIPVAERYLHIAPEASSS